MWKNLTKSQLDAAYNNSKAVPNSAEIIQAWQLSSNDVKNTLAYKADIPYAGDDFPAFDFYLANKNAPTVAFIHGGFWQMRSKDDFAFIVPALLEKKINVAMLGYRLAPSVTMDQIVKDIQDGIRSTINLLKNDGFIQPKVWLIGWSAGAHLASMQMNDENILGVTAISGIYDLDPMRFCYVNDQLKLDEEASRRNSPMLLPQHPEKILDVYVGSDELPEMQGQSQNYFDYRKTLNAPGIFTNIPFKNHYTILDELTQPNGAILEQLIERINSISSA
ncbi:alpha/beta hydrolase [Polynucleobacter kasalickyi]|uniref:Arylformamidase n=1 Tax=Polynucleobacter kasalickyi TaxID=1938817 RepID=A0A1W1YLC0_9BURK|nr:alpha/beta hydrolase [Polynucleobacter kasalickyi]SMC36916.1 arylformamidase [Polynucleobacter kasalickyi]